MPIQKKIVMIVLLVFVVAFPFLANNEYYVQFGINMLMYAFFATAWNIIGGYGGQMAMGNGVYIGIGAYVSTVLYVYENVSPWIGMIIGGLVAAMLAFLLGLATFRLSGSYFSLSTVAMLHVMRMLLYSNSVILGYDTKGAVGLFIPWTGESFWNMQFLAKTPYYYIILVLLALALLISNWIKNSKMGYYLFAIKTNQEAASSLGVNVMGMKLRAGCIAAFLTAVGGTFFVQLIQLVDPTRVLGYDLSAQIMIYCVVGGLGTIWGPVAAAFVLSPLSDILRATLGASMSGLSLVVYGLLMMLIIYFIPNGIWEPIQKGIDKLLCVRKTRKEDGM